MTVKGALHLASGLLEQLEHTSLQKQIGCPECHPYWLRLFSPTVIARWVCPPPRQSMPSKSAGIPHDAEPSNKVLSSKGPLNTKPVHCQPYGLLHSHCSHRFLIDHKFVH